MMSYLLFGLTVVICQAEPVQTPAWLAPANPAGAVGQPRLGLPVSLGDGRLDPLQTPAALGSVYAPGLPNPTRAGSPPLPPTVLPPADNHQLKPYWVAPPNGSAGVVGPPNSGWEKTGNLWWDGPGCGDASAGQPGGFFRRFIKAYCDEFKPKEEKKEEKKEEGHGQDKNGQDQNGQTANGQKPNGQGGSGESVPRNGSDSGGGGESPPKSGSGSGGKEEAKPEAPRRAMPSPWESPPFPGSEYQGYPLIGVPPSDSVYPFMKAVYGGPFGEEIKETRIKFDGWVTTSGNWSVAKSSNAPTSYWIVPNRYELDQLVFRLERYPDTVQTDHIDWGFRSILLYGMDYRYTTAGGWFSNQLLRRNRLYGWDPTEQYFNVYVPGFLGGTDIRVGRWIACPDIETQYSPDNYLGSHSILFTYDTYTQTGVMLTQKINDQWTVQGVIHAGTDMAPWYKGALPTGAFGVRWVAKSNNDAFYTWLNAINNAKFRHFDEGGQPAGHDNFNYVVTTWEHRFSKEVHTKTEAYYMWQRDAELGGTPSLGPVRDFGGGGGDGMLLPGLSRAYGVLNYSAFAISKQDYICVRNEWWKDERGMRSGFPGVYTSHTIGLSHNFNSLFQIRPEIGYYRNWTERAFGLGLRNGIWLYGFDMTLRF